MTLSDFSTPALQADRRLTGELLEDFLGNFPHIRLTVTGGCMNPLLAPGQRVLIASTARRTPRLGDVVLVRHL